MYKKYRFLAVLMIIVFTLGSFGVYANEDIGKASSVEVKGYVQYNNLETGFYEIGEYRLSGEFDFKEYEGKLVMVKGEIDTSPSIYMTKAIGVTAIEEISIDEYKGYLDSQFIKVEDEIIEKKETLAQYLKEYGEESKEVTTLRLKLENLDKVLGKLRIQLAEINESDKDYTAQPIVIEGIVVFNELEGGFFQIGDYRLAGKEDFKKYLGEMVVASGVEDESPSIYMKRGLEIHNIEILDKTEAKQGLQKYADSTLEQIDYINENMDSFIKNYGENSSEVRHYKEELKILKKDAVKILEDIAILDGQSADLAVYKKLGKVIYTEKGKVNLYINGNKPVYEQDIIPFIENSRTLVPYRAVVEKMGAVVEWDEVNKKATVRKGNTTIQLFIGIKVAYVNGEAVTLDVPAKIIYNRTVVPIRFIAESLDAEVEWVPEGNIAVITYDEQKGAPINSEKDFTVSYKDESFKLGQWDYEVDLISVLGEPILEKNEELGEGADTFAGTHIKTKVYDEIEIEMMSPKDNGEAFYISKIYIKTSRYVTARGLKVGDNYEKITENYSLAAMSMPSGYNARRFVYTFHDNDFKNISFDVKNGRIDSITLEKQLP